jgi:integrase
MMTASNPTMRLAGNGRPITQRFSFTAGALARLTIPTEKNDRWIYDSKVIGLAFRLMRSGAGAFYLYRRISGRPTKIRLGGRELTVDQARTRAMRLNGVVASDGDPAATKRALREAESLRSLWERYRDQHLAVRCSPKTLTGAKSLWKTLEQWESRGVLSLTEGDVRGLHARLGTERGKTTANRSIELLRAMYGWARIKPNPGGDKAVKMFEETSRTRFLSEHEMGRFLKAIDNPKINPDIADIVKLSLFTGARRANCQAARDEEFDLLAKTWRIPASKSKSGLEMVVPLVPAAAEIVKRRFGHDSGYLFPGFGASGHIVEVKSTWKKILERAKLSKVHFHDLRRSYASWQANMGASLPIIGRSLGHKSLVATQVYSRLDLGVVRTSATGAVAAMLATAKPAPKKRK